MLHELRIKDFAIIDELSLPFRAGLNVITGETGAGKSIILQALDLLCGGRASADVIRGDTEHAIIEGLFDPPPGSELLETVGGTDDEELLIRRIIARTGKGRAYLNGTPANTSMLARFAGQLINIYGQHDQALLLRPESHLDFLDEFAGLQSLRAQMAAVHADLTAAQQHRASLVRDQSHREERRELLAFQLRELEDASVLPGEEEQLRREREIVRHAERLRQVCHAADTELYSGEHDVIGALARIGHQLHDVAGIDPALAEAAELMDGARVQLEEAARSVRAYAERLEIDPNRSEEIDERLALLVRLARRHNVPSADLPATLETLQRETHALDGLDESLAEAAAALAARLQVAVGVATQLSAARRKAAAKLETLLERELATLGMRGASFRVALTTSDSGDPPGASGHDSIEFHLSANPGESLKPLARVASGGELSRIMLALKALTAATTETPILIFDEVDTGIGGSVVSAVARRLKLLAGTRQLLCITHVPQIAAYADHHFAVEKRTVRGRTVTSARLLNADERIAELARMIGGGTAPAEAERFARRLIAEARDHRPRAETVAR